MSYVVLARKLRPVKFEDLIGQETIWKTLLNAIAKDRVAHAFLFTGPRGIGKTSCARILTKALNCLNPVNHEPCNECENCREINDNVSTDVLEIDAASNRGIEHIRELRDNVKYSPAKSRYKTYIIDEAHMLTIESFNALLKTLEEPPAHVKFILATTDPHKIPQTVISRCQRYDFVRIRMATMVDYLKKVALDEGIIVSEPALTLVARRAGGGMRDALTSLDMLISYAGMNIPEDDVAAILGMSDPAETENLFSAILEKDASRAVSLFQQALERGQSISILLTDLMELVKDITLIKTIPQENNYWRDFLPSQIDLFVSMAEKCSESQLQQYFGILLEVETQIKRSTQAKICMEMGLMRMCRVESLIGVAEVLKQLKNAGSVKKKLLNP
jgi:DNA polymerase-3 subunit gamma/tau